MGTIKDRNAVDLTKEDIKKRWQKYIEELWMEFHNIEQEAMSKTMPKKEK